MSEPVEPNPIRVEPISQTPEFLQLSTLRLRSLGDDAPAFEIVSRRKLDTRAVIPWFRGDAAHGDEGEIFVGICERARGSRALRGAPLVGWEAFAHDFRGADETGDISTPGNQLFQERTGLTPDPARAPIALPSFARSIGYLSELCLPLLLPVLRPNSLSLPITIPQGARLIFMPLREALDHLDAPAPGAAPPHAEELELMLHAFARPDLIAPRRYVKPILESASVTEAARAGDALLQRASSQVVTAAQLQPATAIDQSAIHAQAKPGDLRFLRAFQVTVGTQTIEAVSPKSGVALALLPYIQTSSGPHFLLWDELRPSALERQSRAPLFDLPVSLHHVNATAFFLEPEEAARVVVGDLSGLEALAPGLLGRALGRKVALRSFKLLGRQSEPAPATSSELRVTAAALLDAASFADLPEETRLISAVELSRAIGEGRVRDPVLVHGLLRLAPMLVKAGELPLDPFHDARAGEPGSRRAFLSGMTRGSEVQRRLLGYSSIEGEQLAAETYARLMTFLQHEHGLRVAYPKTEADRSFFKAAFRVFMAADRGDDDRALQGLHWSHDAFHFALGNFIVPPPPDFAVWYASGDDAPKEQPASGPDWESYSRALKTAENEATFFSFWTLYSENFALARHVGKLTFYEAMRNLGVTDRAAARAVYDDVVDRAVLPKSVLDHPVYHSREDLRGLFDYMLGFRAYHYKDIAAAWKYATRDPYRGYLARFGIYEHDLDRYLANVHSFCDRLAKKPRGLNPILCAIADARLDLALRVWDATKALRLLRAGSLAQAEIAQTQAGRSLRASLLDQIEPHLTKLEDLQRALLVLRAQVEDAELTPRNQHTLEEVSRVATRIEAVRSEIWSWAESTGLIAADKLAQERIRELPR